MKQLTLGVIVGTRGFFPAHLCEKGREVILKVLKKEGVKAILLDPKETKYGTVESISDAEKCADLFKKHRDEIDGILVTLPNFGDERAVSNSIRWSGLNVPVLVHAFPDDNDKLDLANRRDSFCGKMSSCNNMLQYGIKYSLTTSHTTDPESNEFSEDLRRFGAICRVVKGLRSARVGLLGARPAPFNTVRFSEKLFEQSGISVEPLDLSEVIDKARKMKEDDAAFKAKIEELYSYIPTKGVPSEATKRMAKMGVVIDQWIKDQHLVGTAIQCWTALEETYGVVPCTLMSMMSNQLIPSACETDICGLVGMYAMVLASGKPSAIVDWNNNYGLDADKAIIFHCSNLPKDVFVNITGDSEGDAHMDYQAIISGSVGVDNAYGTVVGRIKPSTVTYCRVATNDYQGKITAYMGEGKITNDPVNTFGGYGVIQIPNFQKLLRYICENGYEHHVAINQSSVSLALEEAFSKYLGWSVYLHQ